ncbi:MAG TPA: hypothetical protein VGO94_09440 [Mycobacteriales bacterium]|nr:hypothetical protein [Mycobacteriales bacterium]
MLSRAVCWTLALTATAVLVPVPAHAEARAVVIVLDASAAMDRPAPAGGTRLDEAKRALRAVVTALPPGTPVGLRVYGSQSGPRPAGRGARCRDTRLVTPVGPLDAVRFTAALDGVTARGRAAVGHALRQVGADTPGAALPTVVLVSTGVEDCGVPEPCAVARSLAAQPIPVRIHTVGLGLGDDRRARERLRCIAREGGGTFREAAEDASLAEAVLASIGDGARPSPTGGAVRGGPDPVTAPPIHDAVYTDTLPRGEPRYYAVEVAPGQRLAATVSVGSAPVAACPGVLDLALLTPALTEPRYDPQRRRRAPLGEGAAVAARTAAPAADAWTRGTDEDPAGTWWVRATARPGRCDEPHPVVPYGVRLAVTLSGGAPVAAPGERPVRGGATISDAASLLPGTGPVTDALAAGESRWWRFETRDGTEAHARFVLGGVPGAACRATLRARMLDRNGMAVDAGSVWSDGREPVALRLDSAEIGPDADGTWHVEAALSPASCAAAPPVRLLAEVRPYLAPAAEPVAVPVPRETPRDDAAVRWWLVVVLLSTALGITLLAALVAAVARRPRRAEAGRTVPAAPAPVVVPPPGAVADSEQPEPGQAPGPTPTPAPVPEPTRTGTPGPRPEPGPTRTPEPTPTAAPGPVPEPTAAPGPMPEPGPTSTPESTPTAAPGPVPGPTAAPGPVPEPGPTRTPESTPTAAPGPPRRRTRGRTPSPTPAPEPPAPGPPPPLADDGLYHRPLG